jgi:tRNA dimethylallyltransferase
MNGPDAILIAGPTASGKSALALALAERLGGIVINADSMQVYRDLRILTARPAPEEEARVAHRLYGHVDAAETYSVGRWLADAQAALAHARRLGRVPIFAGGTGLYFKALTRGLTVIPAIPPEIRKAARARLRQQGAPTLHVELSERDPVSAAKIRPADGVRIVRALEVHEATGRSLLDWHRDGMSPPLDPARTEKMFLAPPRAELYGRIDTRLDAMLAAGALKEVSALVARNLDPVCPPMKAHGVPWFRRHLVGEMSLVDATEQAKQDIRRYSKRQFTWFRHQLPDWPHVSPETALPELLAALSR